MKKFCEYYCYNKINSVNLKKIESFFNSIINLSNFEKVRAFFIKYHLPILLRRLDFSLMSAGIEGREPLISKEIFYESLKYKSNEIIDKKHGKKPLRNFLKNFMGKEFSYRGKIGFPVDLRKIFKQSINNTETNYDLWFKKNLEEIKKL